MAGIGFDPLCQPPLHLLSLLGLVLAKQLMPPKEIVGQESCAGEREFKSPSPAEASQSHPVPPTPPHPHRDIGLTFTSQGTDLWDLAVSNFFLKANGF